MNDDETYKSLGLSRLVSPTEQDLKEKAERSLVESVYQKLKGFSHHDNTISPHDFGLFLKDRLPELDEARKEESIDAIFRVFQNGSNGEKYNVLWAFETVIPTVEDPTKRVEYVMEIADILTKDSHYWVQDFGQHTLVETAKSLPKKQGFDLGIHVGKIIRNIEFDLRKKETYEGSLAQVKQRVARTTTAYRKKKKEVVRDHGESIARLENFKAVYNKEKKKFEETYRKKIHDAIQGLEAKEEILRKNPLSEITFTRGDREAESLRKLRDNLRHQEKTVNERIEYHTGNEKRAMDQAVRSVESWSSTIVKYQFFERFVDLVSGERKKEEEESKRVFLPGGYLCHSPLKTETEKMSNYWEVWQGLPFPIGDFEDHAAADGNVGLRYQTFTEKKKSGRVQKNEENYVWVDPTVRRVLEKDPNSVILAFMEKSGEGRMKAIYLSPQDSDIGYVVERAQELNQGIMAEKG